jgi:hypothetical protein
VDWSSETISIVTASVATSLAALFAAIAYFVKQRRTRREAFSLALFQLLRIRRDLVVLSQARLDEFLACYLEELQRADPTVTFLEPEKAGMRTMLLEITQHVATTNIDQRALSSDFNAAAKSVAKMDALVAYQLAGNPTVKTALAAIDRILAQLASAAERSLTADEMDVVRKVFRQLAGQASEEVLQDLDRDVLLLARRVGCLTWFRTARALKAGRRVPSSSEMRPFIARMVATVKNSLHEHSASKQAAPED